MVKVEKGEVPTDPNTEQLVLEPFSQVMATMMHDYVAKRTALSQARVTQRETHSRTASGYGQRLWCVIVGKVDDIVKGNVRDIEDMQRI